MIYPAIDNWSFAGDNGFVAHPAGVKGNCHTSTL
jgi:hypothetical protein